MHQLFRGSFKPLPSVFQGLRGCRLPAGKCIKCSVAASTKDSSQCRLVFRGCEAAFANPQMHQMLRGSFDHGLKPVPSGFKGLRGCRLPARKCIKFSVAAWTKDSSQCPLLLRASEASVCQHANASTVPWQLRPRTQGLKPLPSVFEGLRGCRKCIKCSVAAPTTDSSQYPLALRASEAAVCQAANASNAPWQLRPRTQASALWF